MPEAAFASCCSCLALFGAMPAPPPSAPSAPASLSLVVQIGSRCSLSRDAMLLRGGGGSRSATCRKLLCRGRPSPSGGSIVSMFLSVAAAASSRNLLLQVRRHFGLRGTGFGPLCLIHGTPQVYHFVSNINCVCPRPRPPVPRWGRTQGHASQKTKGKKQRIDRKERGAMSDNGATTGKDSREVSVGWSAITAFSLSNLVPLFCKPSPISPPVCVERGAFF